MRVLQVIYFPLNSVTDKGWHHYSGKHYVEDEIFLLVSALVSQSVKSL